MKKLFIIGVPLISVFSCSENDTVKPIWVNRAKTIHIPSDTLCFTSEIHQWNAVILSFTQPIAVQTHSTNTGFQISLDDLSGVIQGPATLQLMQGQTKYFYDLSIANDPGTSPLDIEFRSPKTVNPDSSLEQQIITTRTDKWRNLIPDIASKHYFEETWFSISPVAGTFRGKKNEPLTAFYVQPGSTLPFDISIRYTKDHDEFVVVAGPLKDKYQNIVADGTSVSFHYSNGSNEYTTVALSIRGLATAIIPGSFKHFRLYAKVNETRSLTTTLKP